FLWSTTETSASIDVSPTASASYSVTVTDGNGCTDTESFNVAVNALPTASITGDDAICASEMATLTATGGTVFLWSTTETSASIDVSPTASASYSNFQCGGERFANGQHHGRRRHLCQRNGDTDGHGRNGFPLEHDGDQRQH
ncbi:MAG: hypothetical protein MUC59_05060, partial [Saprospiraceae bacterium]|nr:hypothetical protein [Saprospiraceae bacterium]